jgi:hypothetical protein
MVAVFLLRIDSVSNRPEGDVYYVKKKGIINCNFWNSPKLIDHQIIIASGKEAINNVFKSYPDYCITEFNLYENFTKNI